MHAGTAPVTDAGLCPEGWLPHDSLIFHTAAIMVRANYWFLSPRASCFGARVCECAHTRVGATGERGVRIKKKEKRKTRKGKMEKTIPKLHKPRIKTVTVWNRVSCVYIGVFKKLVKKKTESTFSLVRAIRRRPDGFAQVCRAVDRAPSSMRISTLQ